MTNRIATTFFIICLAFTSRAQMPEQVKDINSGATGSAPSQFVSMNGKLYFVADDGTNGAELWETDGTEAGTKLVADIRSGAQASDIQYMAAMKNQLYFRAFDGGTNGNELFASDGTSSGTAMLKDIYAKGGSNVSEIVVAGDHLFFSATNGSDPFNATTERGYEPWYSNGTASNTSRYADIYAGYGSSYPKKFVAVGKAAFWIATTDSKGEELYRGLAGSSVSTLEVRTNIFDSEIRNMTKVGDRLFFTANNGSNGQELYVVGQTGSYTMVKDIYSGSSSSNPSNLCDFNGLCYFTCNDGSGKGTELWKSDGTSAGTQMVMDLNSGSGSANIKSMVAVGNWLFFLADDGTGYSAYASDGTASGTAKFYAMSTPTDNNVTIHETVAINNKLYLTFTLDTLTQVLLGTDGTLSGSNLILGPKTGFGMAENLFAHNEVLYFSANNGSDGAELWKLDDPCNHVTARLLNDDAVFFCEGDSLKLKTTYSSEVKYQWFFEGKPINGAEYDSLMAKQAGLYQVVVDHKTETSCASAKAEITVIERARPNAVLTDNLINHQVCPNGTVTFKASGGVEYNFLYNGASLGISSTDSIVVDGPADGDVIGLIAFKNGCESDSPTEIVLEHYKVDPITLTSSEPNNEACDGTEVTFTAGTGFNEYTFWVNGNQKQKGTDTEYKHSATNTYKVKVGGTDDNSCLVTKEIEMVMNDFPSKPTISQNGDQLSVSTQYIAYQWYLEGKEIDSATMNTYDATGSGNYSVKVTSKNGCSTLSNDYYLQHSDINDISKANLHVYPNPFDNQLAVQSEEDVISIKLYSVHGKLIMSTFQNQLNTNDLPSGQYLMVIELNEGLYRQQLIKN